MIKSKKLRIRRKRLSMIRKRSEIQMSKHSKILMTEMKKHSWERNFYGDADPAMESDGYIER